MLNYISNVLNAEQINHAKAIVWGGEFKDGAGYVNEYVKTIKKNEELSLDREKTNALNNIVLGSLYKHPIFTKMAFPGKISEPIYAHYSSGMKYGYHVDTAIMGRPNNYFRSDISCTIFLNDADDYEGGELVIQTGYGPQKVKMAAGDAVLYPSTSLHQVEEVTKGDRLVAVCWIHSMVPDAEKRAMLYQFGESVEKLAKEKPDAQETLDLTRICENLKRRWIVG